jgi:DUF1680 family protein
MKACNALWNNIVKRQMYITGAIGQSDYGEAFSYDYSLPNDTVYAETCAAIGLVFFAKRMASAAPNGAYGDVIEKALFNSVISGMSLDGKAFFYVNPLEVIPQASLKDRRMRHVKVERQKWFACACCPPNLARLLASLGAYIHSVREDVLYTHLFIGSEAKASVSGTDVSIKIDSQFPWEGKVDVSFTMSEKRKFKYYFRVPGWCKKFRVCLNGVEHNCDIEDGYAFIEREWAGGDKVSIVFDMPVEFVRTNPHVRENIGKTAVLRGPVVYCAEEADNGGELFRLHTGDVNNPRNVQVRHEKDLLEGVTTISFTGRREKDWDNDTLYDAAETAYEDKEITLIPYYAWANRKAGEMTVWLNK